MGSDATSALIAVGRSALVLTGGMVASQAFVVVRELFIAAQSGVSSSLDALFVGIILPTSIGGVLTAGTTVALVPAYLSVRSHEGHASAQRFSGYVLFWVAVASFMLWLLLTVFADEIVAIAGTGLAPQDKLDAAEYMRIVAPVTFVFGLYGILVGICQAEERFLSMAAAIVGIGAVSVIVTVLFWDPLGMTAYAVGGLAGPIAGLSIVVVELARRSSLPRPTPRPSGYDFGSYLGQAVPLIISASILQLNAVADAAVASLLEQGSIGALRFGHLIAVVPIGAIGVAWGAAIYPQLVKSTLGNDAARLSTLTSTAIRFALATFVPISVLTLAEAPLAVSVSLGRGEFGTEDIERTTLVVVGYAPLIALSMATKPLVGAINARRRGFVLLVGGIINVTSNIILSIVLGLTVGVIGVALATSITAAIIAVYFSRSVHRTEPSFDERRVLRVLGRAVLAVIPGAVVAAWVVWSGWKGLDMLQGLTVLGVLGTGGLAAYFIFARIMGMHEPSVILMVAARFTKQRLLGVHR